MIDNSGAASPDHRQCPAGSAGWRLWLLPRPALAWVLGWESATALAVLVALLATEPDTAVGFGYRLPVLLAAAGAHAALTWRREETSRDRSGPYLGLTNIWIFAGVLTLPVTQLLLLVALVRTGYWLVSRRPAHRYLFSTCSITLSALSAHTLLRLAEITPWRPPGTDWATSPEPLAVVVAAGTAALTVEAVLVGGVIALSTGRRGWRTLLGGPVENTVQVLTLAAGAVTAVLLVQAPALVAVMVAVAAVGKEYLELRRLRVDAVTDPLTGLANRRGWSATARRVLERASRDGQPVSVLLIDADHFKSINDRFGHPAGDTVLRALAATLAESVRPGDSVGRWGGEEFVALLPGTGRREAALVAERLRIACSDQQVDVTDRRGQRSRLSARTVSVGVATLVRAGGARGVDQLVSAGDSALYAAKRAGRNCVRAVQVTDATAGSA